MNTINSITALHGLLDKKLSIFQQYFLITKDFKQAINDPGVKKIRHLMLERQHYIKKINCFDDQINDILQDLIADSGNIPCEISELFDMYGIRIKKIIEAILPFDNALSNFLNSESNTLKEMILKLQQNRKVMKTYGKKFGHTPKFLDTRR